MAWIESFSLVMRSNLTALRERVEDPEKMLHQLLIDMEEEHERVRQSVAGAIADEILLRKRLQQARDEADDWLARATTALRAGNETNGELALEHKQRASERAEALEREYLKQKEQTASLQRSVADLEDKIRQAKQKQTLLLARMARADSSQRINAALRRADSKSAFAQFDRMEQRVDRAEAMEEAYERLEGKDPDAEALKAQFDEQQRQAKVAAELASLRARLTNTQGSDSADETSEK